MRTRRIVGAVVFAIALIPLAILGYGQAKAERLNDWSCADQATGTGVTFCVTLPKPAGAEGTLSRDVDQAKISVLAKIKGIQLENVATARADLWVEQAVTPDVRRLLTSSLDADLAQIINDFGP